MGRNAGLTTLLVGTGVHSLADVRKWESSPDHEMKKCLPHYYAESVAHLLPHAKKLL